MFDRKIIGTIGKDKRGFSLLEVMIVSLIFSVIILAAFGMMAVGIDIEDSTVTIGDMEDRSRMVLERIVGELQGAIMDTVIINATNDMIIFQVNEGYVGGEVQASTVRMFGLEYDTGEDMFGNDGLDNNGNDMIDEGLVVRVVEDEFGAPVDTTTLAHWIRGYDYRTRQTVQGLFFGLSGRNLTIRLEMQRRDAKGRLLQSISQTSIRIRN